MSLLRGPVREVRGPDRELLRGRQLRGRQWSPTPRASRTWTPPRPSRPGHSGQGLQGRDDPAGRPSHTRRRRAGGPSRRASCSSTGSGRTSTRLPTARPRATSVVGKFAVAPLPGETGPGASTLGGHNSPSPRSPNKATALDFIKFMTSEESAAGEAHQGVPRTGLQPAVRRPGAGQEVPLPAGAEGVHPERGAAAPRGPVRRRHDRRSRRRRTRH